MKLETVEKIQKQLDKAVYEKNAKGLTNEML